MKQSFWINFELEQQNSVSHFCLITGIETLDCGYRVLGSLLLLLATSEVIPGLAGTLGDCRMFQFIHYVWKASFVHVGFSRTWRNELFNADQFN